MRWGLAKLNNDAYTMTDLFDDFFRLPVEFKDSGISMKMDVHEDEKAVYVKAELPGLDEKDLNVSLQNNILTISGEKKEEKTEEDKRSNYYYCERSFGSFERSIQLPEGIKADAIKAHYKNGVLDIELPKEEKAQPRKIDVAVN